MRSNRATETDYVEFSRLRDRAIDYLLTVAYEIRRMDGQNYVGINYREELLRDDDTSQRFLRLMQTRLSSLLQVDAVHTVTAFSLPEGRQPAGVDLWTFLAFEQIEGDLQIKTLEILDPRDRRPPRRIGYKRNSQCSESRSRIFRTLWMNPPKRSYRVKYSRQKANAGICQLGSTTPKKAWLQTHPALPVHSFNREIFNLHSLSYLEDDEITVSPRVVADVEHELEWIERWRNREFESRD